MSARTTATPLMERRGRTVVSRDCDAPLATRVGTRSNVEFTLAIGGLFQVEMNLLGTWRDVCAPWVAPSCHPGRRLSGGRLFGRHNASRDFWRQQLGEHRFQICPRLHL